MAFKSKTGSLLHAGDPWKSGSLFGSLIRYGRDVIEGVVSWGGRKGADVQSLAWRSGAPWARSSTQAISIACRIQKPSTVVKNIFSGFLGRSHPQSLASKYAARITPQPYWSAFRSPEQFRLLGRRLATYSFVGLSFAAGCQRQEFFSKDCMSYDEVCNDIQKMFSDRLVYEASCASVERMMSANVENYEFGRLLQTSGHAACFEAKFKSLSTDEHLSSDTSIELGSFEAISECECDASLVSEDGDLSVTSVMPSLESGLNQAVEAVLSHQKCINDIYEAICGQNKELSVSVNVLLPDEDNADSDSDASIEVIPGCFADKDYVDSDSDSSIEVICSWQENSIDYFEETSSSVGGSSFDYDEDDDDASSTVRQLEQDSALAKKQQMELTELLTTLIDLRRRTQLWVSSSKPQDDFNLVLKVRWMTDCSLEYASGVLMNELLPISDVYSVDQDWARNGLRVPSHFNIVPVIGGFLTTLQQLKVVPVCQDALPSVSSWQHDIAVCVVTKRYEVTLAEFLASHEPGVGDAMLMFVQLVEAVNHLSNHKICHRNLKSDNIFIEQLADGPHLLVANFGSSLHITTKFGLPVASANDMRRCSGSYLMAPECFTARSPLHQACTKADLWACGAIAYEIFGAANPFRQVYNGRKLTSSNYQESDLPDLPGSAPSCVSRLVKLMLKRDPKKRPDPELIANVLHLRLWAPDHWKHSLPNRLEIMRWITQFAAETFLLSSPNNFQRRNDTNCSNISVVNALKVQFLSRANTSSVAEAARLLWEVSVDES